MTDARTAPPGPLGYRPQLDGIRALAIALVVLFHTDRGGHLPVLSGGFLGVDVFFVLSGFLITSLLIDERAGAGRIRLGAFWGRRVARLFPLLWGLLAFMAFARWVHPIRGITPPSTGGFVALLTYVGNWIPATGRNGLFELQYLWSLSVEEQFYVLWPLLVVAALGIGVGVGAARPVRSNGDGGRAERDAAVGRRRVAGLAFALAGAVVLARATAFADTDFFFNTFLRANGLLLGAGLAATRRWWQPRIGSAGSLVLAALGAVAVAAAVHGALVGSASVSTWRLPLLEVGVLALTAALVAAPTTLLGVALGWSPLVWLGRCSYALYLIHLPLFDVLEAHLGADRPRLRAVVEIPLAIALAVAVHLAFELPMQRVLRRWLRADHRRDDHAPEIPGDAASAS